MILSSAAHAIKSGSLVTKGGEIPQLGADLVFDSTGQPIFAHRMVTGRDHTEYLILAEKCGLKVEGH